MFFGNAKDSVKVWFRTPMFYFCLFFMILNLFLTKQMMEEKGLGGFVWVAMVQLIIECIVIYVLSRMRKKGVRIERQFLFVAVVLGIMFIVVLPPGQSPDEAGHFMRAYGISDGYLVADSLGDDGTVGSPIPVETDFLLSQAGWRDEERGVYKGVRDELWRGRTGETEMRAYNTLAVYNFMCYLPQSIAIIIGKAFGLSVLAMAYLAEVFNFVVWLLLMYFAIKLIPKFKTALLFMALLPITIQEATSLAPDAMAIGLGAFMIAYVLYLTYAKKTEIVMKEKVLLCIVALMMSLCKIVYLPMVFLYLILPKERFGSKKKKWFFVGGIIAISIVVNLLWLMNSFGYIMETTPGVDAAAQAGWVITHPMSYIGIMIHTVDVYSLRWIEEALGMSLGAVDFHLPMLYFVSSFVILIVILAQRNETLKMKKIDRCVMIGVFAAVCILIFTSLYVQWTAYGNDIIEGIQGRYFLPILALLPAMICRTKGSGQRFAVSISNKTVMNYSLFSGLIACTTILIQNI